jgi:hypothetical protein
MIKKETKGKIAIYGSNFIAGAIGNQFNYNLGNPIGAIVYGGLDLMKSAFPKLKENKYIRLTEVAGALGYGVSTVKDLVGILHGDLNSLAQLPFDVGMVYETGKNVKEDYEHSKTNLGDDLVSVAGDIVNVIDYFKSTWINKLNAKINLKDNISDDKKILNSEAKQKRKNSLEKVSKSKIVTKTPELNMDVLEIREKEANGYFVNGDYKNSNYLYEELIELNPESKLFYQGRIKNMNIVEEKPLNKTILHDKNKEHKFIDVKPEIEKKDGLEKAVMVSPLQSLLGEEKYLKGKTGKFFNRAEDTPETSFFKLFNERDGVALFDFNGDESEAIAKRIFSEDICDIVSGGYQNANSVKTNPGKVKYVCDRWEVIEPIKVFLENK